MDDEKLDYEFNFFDNSYHSSYEILEIIKNIKTKSSLEDLQSKDKIANYFKCMSPECSFSTNEKDLFLAHIVLHEDKSFTCCYCLSSYQSAEDLIEHVVDKHAQRCFQCSLCFYRASTSVQVKFHIKRFHADASILICPSGCNNSVDENHNFSQNIDPYECINLKCSFSTISSDLYFKHLQIHGINICFICEIPFTNSKLLKAHHLEHKIGQFQCPFCRFGAKDRDGLLTHQSLMHPDNPLLVFDRNYVPKNISNGSSLYPLQRNGSNQPRNIRATPPVNRLPSTTSNSSILSSEDNSDRNHRSDGEEDDVMSLLLNPQMSIEVGDKRLVLNEKDVPSIAQHPLPTPFNHRSQQQGPLHYQSFIETTNLNLNSDSCNFLQTQMLNELSCELCNTSTKDFNAMKRHLNFAHNITMMFNCGYCNEPGKTQDQIKIHIKKRHPKSMMKIKKLYTSKTYYFTCPFCKYHTDKKVNFRNHLCMELGNEGYVCSICKASTTRESIMIDHLTEKHGKIHANDFLNDKESLKIRVDQIMPILSKRLFPHPSKLREGVLIEELDDKSEITVFSTLHFTCPECTQRFRIPIDLSQHISENHIHHLTAKFQTDNEEEFILGIDEASTATDSTSTQEKVSAWILEEVEKQKHELVEKLKQVHSIGLFSDNQPPKPGVKMAQDDALYSGSNTASPSSSNLSNIEILDVSGGGDSGQSIPKPTRQKQTARKSFQEPSTPKKLIFKCGHCSEFFNLLIQAKRHTSVKHADKEFSCKRLFEDDSTTTDNDSEIAPNGDSKYLPVEELHIIDDEGDEVELIEYIDSSTQLKIKPKVTLKNVFQFF